MKVLNLLTKSLNVLLYLVFTAGAIAFVSQSIREYLEFKTSLLVTKEPITLDDLPTVMLCFTIHEWGIKRNYGQDFVIETLVWNKGQKVTLEEKTVAEPFPGLEVFLSRVSADTHLHCYKISTKWYGKEDVDVQKFMLNIAIDFIKMNPPNLVETTITSEPNSYGAILNRWYDGNAERLFMEPGKGYSATIVDIREYSYLKWNCTSDSYYECLGKRMTNLKKNQMFHIGEFDKMCNFNKICTPFTLPYAGINIPICNNQQDKDCYKQVLKQLRLDQHKHCKKACHVKEFILDSKKEHGHKISNNPNKFALDLSFNLPSSTQNLRSDEPFKTMFTEYSTLSEMTLLGTHKQIS